MLFYCRCCAIYFDHVEILGPNTMSHNLYLSNGTSQQTDSPNGFQNGYVYNGFKSTNYNSCPSTKHNDVDMHCDDVQETTTIKTNSGNHYLNQPVRCLSLCGHLQ